MKALKSFGLTLLLMVVGFIGMMLIAYAPITFGVTMIIIILWAFVHIMLYWRHASVTYIVAGGNGLLLLTAFIVIWAFIYEMNR